MWVGWTREEKLLEQTYQQKLTTILLAGSTTILAISMITLPKETVDASIRGLNMWWGIVFPSLFPFFVISELLIRFGVVKFLGVLLEPLMRPFFRVPGVGGFALAMGMATGFPAGAKITARLREENQISRTEAERLVSFTNSSSPLFIFGAVSVGFFHNAKLGMLLAIVHYLGNISVGLIMRFYGKKETAKSPTKKSIFHTLSEALTVLHKTRIENKQPIGKLLGESVISSIHTLLMVGGFIILFSVLNQLFLHLKVIPLLATLITHILTIFQFPVELASPLIAGFFEITIGSQFISQIQNSTLLQQTILVSFILGFNGFSVHAQVASILANTDISFKPFFVARLFHGCIASVFTFLLWKPFNQFLAIESTDTFIPVFFMGRKEWWDNTLFWLEKTGPLLTITCLGLYIIFYLAITIKKDPISRN